jgi:hypothetical protein
MTDTQININYITGFSKWQQFAEYEGEEIQENMRKAGKTADTYVSAVVVCTWLCYTEAKERGA